MPANKKMTTWAEHVMAGEAFSAENFLIGVGGTVAQIQLFNPVASGKRIRLRSVHSIITVASGVNLLRHDTPLGTLGVPAGFVIENLLGGGQAEVAEMRSDQPVAAAGSLFWQLGAPGSVPAIYPPGGREWGHDLLEGQGIHMQGAVGLTSIINWQWVEIPL